MIKCGFGKRYFFFNMGIAWCNAVSKWSAFGHLQALGCFTIAYKTQQTGTFFCKVPVLIFLNYSVILEKIICSKTMQSNITFLRELCLIFRVNWISSVYVSSWRLGCDVTFKVSALFWFTISGQWLITKGVIQGLAHFLLTLLVGARNGKLHLTYVQEFFVYHFCPINFILSFIKTKDQS